MNKFENVDIIESLNAIMQQNTAFYQGDFEADKEFIRRVSASPDAADKTLIWISHPSRTHCSRERSVFIKDIFEYKTWRYYAEQTSDRILAYAVTITSSDNEKINGSLYELDYRQYFKHVVEQAFTAETCILFYEHGQREQPVGSGFKVTQDQQLGQLERYVIQPKDPRALYSLLEREQLLPGNINGHIIALRNNRIRLEAGRILLELKALEKPNSPEKTHFMVELSPYFTALASSEDINSLLFILPFNTLSISNLKDRHKIYVFLPKDEDRYKRLCTTTM